VRRSQESSQRAPRAGDAAADIGIKSLMRRHWPRRLPVTLIEPTLVVEIDPTPPTSSTDGGT